MTQVVRPVILCGGAGTRLWPLSRQQFPKQLLKLTGEQSLLQETVARLSGERFAPAVIVSGEQQGFAIKHQLESANAAVEAILLEPVGRNTSAAAALVAAWLMSKRRDELLLLMPSDHVIADRDALLKAVAVGVPHADEGAIVTFGAQPTEPNTQYGYIEGKTAEGFPDGAFPIARFHEKPDAANAADYVSSGRFFWNCGIFLVKASTLLEEMRHFLGDSLAQINSSIEHATTDDIFVRPEAATFARADNISIDHGVMERTARGVVVPVDMQWSDIGSWDAVWKLGSKDSGNNAIQGDVVVLDTRDSLIRNEGKALVAGIGLEKMAVVATADALVIAPMDRAGEIRDLVETLKSQARECVNSPAKVERPWGSYEVIGQGPGFQVKRIIVEPGEALSLQLHHHRSEHWIVIRGSAEVTVGETISMLKENESAFIPVDTKHRLANPRKAPLELIEVQSGDYLGEDDIVRFDDRYGRADREETERSSGSDS
ncbi:MAG: mannose-1-phosphate guanylyltransferase/mannose-6-phosphate isomerase [Sphingomicrobium sp.]